MTVPPGGSALRHVRVVLAILAIGVLARVAAALALGGSFHFPDEVSYVDAARRLLSGVGFGAEYGRVPAYPVFLAAFAALPGAGVNVLFLRLAQAVVTAIGVVLVYRLAVRAYGKPGALVGAICYALDPLFIVAAGLFYPEAVAAVLVIVLVLGTLETARTNRLGWAAATGLLLGLLIQLRPVSLLVVPVLGGWLLLAEAGGVRRRRVLCTAVLVLACVGSLAPWTYRNYRVHGRLVPVATAGTRTAPVSVTEVREHGLTSSLLHRAVTRPLTFGKRWVREFTHFWELYPTRLATDDPHRRSAMRSKEARLDSQPVVQRALRNRLSAASFGCELTLALVGVAWAWRTRRKETILLLAVILSYAVGYAVFVAKLRYRIPVLPLLFVFSGLGVDRVRALCATWWAGAAPRGFRQPRTEY